MTNPSAPHPLDTAFSAEWLSHQSLPPVEYVVPGIIPEGLTLLVAPPKVGKSWMVLGIALAAAEGSHVFSAIRVARRPVLYLALEDGPRRLQYRMRDLGINQGPSGLMFLTHLETPAVTVIQAFLDRHADEKPLIILDTLGKIRGTYGGNDAYGNDYTQMSALKDLADAVPGASLIVVHHTNKGEKSDFLDSVSGTQGLAGAADSILAIKRSRNSGEAVLHVTSRDAAEGEYAITMSNGVWQLEGSSLKEAAQAVRTTEVKEHLGDDSASIIGFIADRPEGVRTAEVSTAMGWPDKKTRTYLARLVEGGRLERPERGLYTPVASVASVALWGQPPNDNTTHTTHATHPQGQEDIPA